MIKNDRLEKFNQLSPAEKALLLKKLQERKAAVATAATTATRATAAGPGIRRRSGSGAPPLSAGQRRMWLAQQIDPESPNANLMVPLRLDGELDLGALGAGLSEVVRRHEVLRTGIASPEGEPVAAVAPPAPLRIPLIDLAALPPALAEAAGTRLAAEEARRPFDLARPPMLRAVLARTAPGSHLLLLTLHHVAADGWSIAILVREMVALYGAGAAGRPSPLPELPLQYADFAAWQQERQAAGDLAADLDYWRRQLAGLPPLALFGERPRPAGAASRTVRPPVLLPDGLTAPLQELARRERGTLFLPLAAAFAAFLGRLAEQDDIAFATPVAGRARLETEGLIGFFVNTLVLRSHLGEGTSLRQLTARLRETLADAQDHQQLPFERLVEELAPERRAGRHPLVQALFAFQNAPREALAIPGLTVSPVEVETGMALFDLAFQVEPREGVIDANLELDEALWGAAAAARLPRELAALLAAAAAEPDRPVRDLPFLSAEERRQLLAPETPTIAPAAAPAAAPAIATGEAIGRLAAIWAEVLGVAEVGEHDSFWQLGGHSLLAARAVARVRQDFGVDLPLRVLFDASTPAELAAVLAAGTGGARAGTSPIRPEGREGPAPLSFGQRRLWFLHQLAPDSPAYNVPLALRMEGALDPGVLAAALSEVVRRHEVLRTAFVTRRGEAALEVAPAAPLPIPVADLSALPAARRDAEARRLAAEEAARPFDLTRAPLLRVLLARLGAGSHLLVFNLHHIASDGWSGGVLVREVGALYAAFAAGLPSPLPELPLQYADYARWQRAELAGERLATLLAYWRQQLDGLPPLALPTDRPRPPVESFRGAHRQRQLPARLAAGLERLAGEHGATLFMVLAAGFAALLGRLSGAEDFGVATPVAGRARTELEGLIGYFVNTLVLRADLAGDPSFAGLLARTRETVLAAFSHQELPFERLVEEAGARRGSPGQQARQPLAQALIVFQNTPREPLVLPGLTLTQEEADNGAAKLDLSLNLARDEAGITAALEIDRDLFDPATAARFLEQLEVLLDAAADEPRTPLSALPLLSPAARHQVTLEWNDGAAAAAELPLHRAFEAVAARRPEAVAITGEAGGLTYGELDRRAGRLARRLRALGVGPESRVGLCLHPSPELVMAILAILKAGGAHVPLDPGYPRERLAFLLADSAAPLVVTRSEHAASLDGARPVLLDLEEDDEARSAAGSSPALADGAGLDHPAYVIYTSGSTGRPKGVVVTHRNVARLLTTTAPAFGFGADDVWTLFHSFAFDFSVWEIWGALLHGGRLVIVPYGVSRSPDAFLALLRREGVTVLNQTPSAFRQLIPLACREGEGDLPLRWVIFGGEALDPRHLAPWFARFGDRHPRLVNMYGITETTVHVTWRPIDAGDARAARSPIGRALPDLALHLLDRSLRPVPIGIPGEICVAGPGVARGYLGRPALTAERFLPDPLAGVAGGRLYRSGDLARWLADGDLEVLGRIDQQVKVRGFRIELGEIEAALDGHPGVRESAVLLREEADGERRLVAWVVPREGNVAALGAGELRSFLQERLPAHMLPAAFVSLAALPLTRHGKLDRAALPAPGLAAVAAAPFAPPETPVEQAVAASWGEVLDLPRIGLDDDFFALGGDSIRAIQVRSRAEERRVFFTLQDLFRFPTVRSLARAVRSAPEGETAADPTHPAVLGSLLSAEDRARLPAGIEDAFPLARTLAGLVFHSEYSPDYLIYLTSFELAVHFDAARLQEALDRTVARHPVLRSSLALEGFSEPLHLVHRETAVRLAVEDLRPLPPAEREAAFGRWFAAEQRRKFDWRRPPLLRLTVHRRSDEAFQLTLSEPFLDGWSVGLFLTELFHRYLVLLPPGAVPAAAELPPVDERPLAATFRDYVALEREALASADCRRYWERRTDGGAGRLPVSPVARRLGGAPGPGELQTGRCEVAVSEAVSDGLWAASRAASAPLKNLLLAVHLKALSFLTGSRDVVSGVLANGRPEGADGDRVIGGFLNAMPFRVDLAPGSWLALARQVFDAERELLAYRRFPLSELQQKQTEVGRPLFDALFNFTHFHVYDRLASFPGLTVLGSQGTEQTYFPLTAQFNVQELSHRVALAFDHPLADLDPREVAAIAARYARILEAVAADPAAPHDALCLLDAAERQQVLLEWGATPEIPGAGGAVHELFAAQAARTPEAPAVLWGEEVVTYAGLAARAGQVARRLLALRLPPEARVGLLLDRSPDLVAAILGIAQAGAAYVPLDPDYPRERLDAMLEDSGARALVSRRGLGPWDEGEMPAGRIDLEELAGAAVARADIGAELPAVDPDRLFAVIYTSGSTGRPKGVAVAHRSVAAFLAGAAALYPPEETAMLAGASVCFDLSIFELFLPLTRGGAAVLAESALELPRLPARDAVRLLAIVPSAAAELLRGGGVPAGIRTFCLGGEALPPGLARALLASSEGSGRRLLNAYGPTEATIYAIVSRIDPADLEGGAAPPIGLPVPGGRALLLDADLQPVLPGVPGEIWLGGQGLARGYLGRPELTAERFRPDPWSALGGEPGGRLYRSGDLGRRRPDGRIEFLGRRDHQVKVRGFRIELGDVEAALARHPGLESAAVVDLRDPAAPGEARLVAYAVPRRGLPAAGPWGAELRGFLRRLLPAYMIPSAFVVLDALPFTATGKLDRHALPAPGAEGQAAERPWTAPRTPVEEVLAALWAELFKLPRVSADDDFFALGGHSLLATQLVSRIREAFALELPLRALFEAPVLSALGREVERALAEGEGTQAPPLVPQPLPADGVPLSFAQQRLWFLDRLEPASPFYNVPVAVRLTGDLDLPALRAALGEIVRRHAALRTRFEVREGRPVQVVEPEAVLAVPVADLAALPAGEGEREAERLAQAEARRPFDLGRAPLLRVSLLRLGSGESLLLAVFHHIVSDGWSMGVFLGEVAALYRAAISGEPSPLPPLPVQYADFALWQRGWLAGEALQGQLSWWRRQLADVPPLALPTDRPRPAVPAYRGGRSPLALPPPATAAVAAFARREGATLFMTLLAAFSAVLGRWAGAELLAVGTPVAGRNRGELEPLIGFFVNTLALRADLSGDPTGRAILARCRETALGAYAHQDLPFEKLVEELRPERELARAPVFQAMLALQNTPAAEFELPGLTLAPVAIEPGTSKFDLTLSAIETAGGIAAWLEHDAHLFDPATAARLAGHFTVALQALAADPGRRLSALPLLASGERQHLLREWAEGPPLPAEWGEDGEDSLLARLAAQAARTPDAVAVAQRERELTYRELHGRAGRLAASLRARGVGPEVTVAIRLAKSPEAIVAILAVLRAGGAYLPLDPDYPEERLAWITADARAALTLDAADIAVNSDATALEDGPEPAPGASPAYVLYTSGSTGRPKGVVVTRAGLLASTRARLEGYAPPVSAFLLIPSLAFDSSVAGIFWTLCQGGTLVLPAAGESADPRRLNELVAARRVSHWLGIPSLWKLCLDAAPPEQLSSLRAVIVAGEACPADLPGRHAACLPGVPLLNEYGPTEGTVWATAGALAAGEPVTIGRPIAGTRVLLLERGLTPAPAGVAAELFLGGAGLARGYLGRPDLTAERFVPAPGLDGEAGGEPGARLYRTGDLARWLPDGRLELLGRADDQVKIRGFRVEPREVEAALERCAGVRQAAVVVRDAPSGDRRLAAAVAPLAGHELDPEALGRDLLERLPAHQVPAEFAVLAALPLTPNGKLDREALKRLFAERAAAPRGAEPPAGDLERRLAAIWEELLDVREVGRADGFFALGGHSLLAVELLARIERDLGRRLPLAALFRGATLAELAAAIESAAPEPAESPASPSSQLLLLQAGAGRPFYCFHPLDGRALCYAGLAHHLAGRALYGLEAAGGITSLEELAARHAGAILEAQPSGPYLLGGWSFGGLVAWETARRLEELGHEVGLLVLIDSRPPGPHTPAPPELDDGTLDALLAAGGPADAADRADLPALRAVAQASLQALRSYRPQPVACPVTLFLAAERRGETAAERAALWRPLAPGRLRVDTLPGDHFQLLAGPAAELLAAKLGPLLDAAGGLS